MGETANFAGELCEFSQRFFGLVPVGIGVWQRTAEFISMVYDHIAYESHPLPFEEKADAAGGMTRRVQNLDFDVIQIQIIPVI